MPSGSGIRLAWQSRLARKHLTDVRKLADRADLRPRPVGRRVVADPALVDRLIRELIAAVGADTQAIGLVVQPAVDKVGVEDDDVARAVVVAEPAPRAQAALDLY